ncbi:MAG: HAD-IA family hydrolase [Candidatus Saccharibacteria bacterium]|nr:HAD-IA family hydrolase [Candidatus Saccharibacteria bacterium]
MDEISLGKTLQTARKKAGITQQELCQKADLSYSTLAKIERGAIKAPSIFTIQSIAAVLGVTLSGLVGDLPPADVQEPVDAKKRSKSGVRFVYFDVNGCLVRFYHRAFSKVSEASGLSADIIETTFWHFNDAVCRGELSMEEFNETLGGRFRLAEFDWRDYYLEAIEPIQEMHELAEWVAKHYRVGLLSNIMPGLIASMLENGLLPKLDYDAIVDSSEVGSIKPEEQIFAIATTKAAVSPEEILLVDDSRANIMAAQRIGWKVLWFDDYRPDESSERVRSALEFDN